MRVCIHTQRRFSAITGSSDDSVSQNHTIAPLFPLIARSNTHTTYTKHWANGNKIRIEQWTKQKETAHTHTHSEKKNTPPQSRKRRPVIAFYIGQKLFGWFLRDLSGTCFARIPHPMLYTFSPPLILSLVRFHTFKSTAPSGLCAVSLDNAKELKEIFDMSDMWHKNRLTRNDNAQHFSGSGIHKCY